MKILFLTNGPITNAGPRSRVFQYLPYFTRDGIEHRVLEAATHWPTTLANRLGQAGAGGARLLRGALRAAQVANLVFAEAQAARSTLLAAAAGHDVLFAQGILLQEPLVRLLQARGTKVVYDFVDPIWLKGGPLQRLDRFHALLARYDLLVLGTTTTEEYVHAHGARRSVVLVGPIDTQAYYPVPRAGRGRVKLGWIGSPSTTLYFEMLRPVLCELCAEHPELDLLTVGASRLDGAGLRLEQRAWSLEREQADLAELDLGIMPLFDDEWCRGKGGYKLLQAMAAGLPTVASPVGVNSAIVLPEQTGLLASSLPEWKAALSRLIGDPALRARLGAAGRERAVDAYSFDVAYPRLKAELEAIVRGA